MHSYPMFLNYVNIEMFLLDVSTLGLNSGLEAHENKISHEFSTHKQLCAFHHLFLQFWVICYLCYAIYRTDKMKLTDTILNHTKRSL